MKKKIILTFLYFSIFFGITLETNAFLGFQVKKSTDSSYASSVENVSQSQELTFNVIKTDGSTSAETFLVNIPSGFTYNGYDPNNLCANFSLKTNSNSSFSYSYNDQNPCNVTFRYTPTTATSGTKIVELLYSSGSQTTQTSVEVSIASSTTKTVTKAVTKDLDNDGYIDAYKIDFSSAVSNISSTGGLTVGGYPIKAYSGTTTSGYILFQDGIFNSGDRPQIISSGTVFGDVGQLGNDSIVEEDGAKPILLKVNNQNVVGVNNISIGAGTITFEFSEKLHPQSEFYFKKGTTTIATLSNSNSSEKIIYTPSSTLTVGAYNLVSSSTSGSEARDYSSNSNVVGNINISLIVNDSETPTGLAIGANTGISINNGTSTTNNRYVQLSLLASDNVGVHQMQIYNSGSSGNWENYSTTKSNWDLTSTGSKTVFVKFKDAAGNISPTYSSTIIYSISTNYLNFNTPSSLYTDSTTITLDGGCNIPANPINYSINNGSVLTITCNGDKTWSKTFMEELLENTQNQIKIWYGADYDSATIKNSITIINPQTSCDTTKYTRVGSTCVPKSCESETKVVDGKTYQVPALSHSSNGNITSNSVSITGGNITYTQNFSCNLGTITANGTATANTPACSSGYSISGSSCVPSSCSAQSKTVNGRTYQVPTLSHSSNGNVTSNTVSISGGTITYTQSFSCSFGVLSENGSETTNTPTCNSGYAINGNQCTLISALACAGSYTDGDKIYGVGTITHLGTGTRTSSPISISNGTITYNQQFSCNATVLTKVGSATANTPTCNSGYSISGNSCVPSNCSSQSKTVNGRTYQVPSLIHNTSGTITSNNVSITGGRISYSQTFKCELGVISAVGSETTNTPTCNSGYKVDGLTCVKKSSGGGGGGGGSFLPTCNTSTDLECRVSGTRYLWQIKFGVSCQGGDVGKVCSSEEVKTGNNENSIDLGQDFINYINKNDGGSNSTEPTLEITKSYLLENTNKSFVKLIEDFRNKIYDKNIEYFITFDKELKNKYISTLVTYKTLFENLDKQLNNKDQTAAINAKQNYSDLDKYISEIKNPEERYVTKKQDENNVIFETNTANIKNTMSGIEKIMFLKYKKLLQTNTIDKEKYNEIVDDYNNFVLYLSIFRNYKDKKAGKLGKEYLSKVVNHYNTKITEKKVIINNETKTTQKIIDVFPLTKDLKFGDYNDEVTTLQKMLKHYGYFDLEPTGYFGNTTGASLEKFTKEFLKTNYNGYLNENIRQKLSELDY